MLANHLEHGGGREGGIGDEPQTRDQTLTTLRELRASRADGAADLSPTFAEISASLVTARREAGVLARFPGTVPTDLASAYRIQSHSIAKWPDTVAGWKVGGIPPNWRDTLGVSWLVGPIFHKSVRFDQAGETSIMPVYRDGFAAIEPELIVRLGESREQDRMFIGAEIASSPVSAINDYGPIAVVCDFGNNNGVLVGREIAEWARFDEPITASIWIDGQLIAERVLEDTFANALAARDFCLENVAQRGLELQPGTLISSGAITGIHEAASGARSTVSFGALGQFELELGNAQPLC